MQIQLTDYNIPLLFLWMTLVTCIPRLLPAVLFNRVRPGKRVKKFLNLIPYTAMAALLFPGILSMDPARPWIGLAGIGVSGLLAWKKASLAVCVLASILTVFILYLVLPVS